MIKLEGEGLPNNYKIPYLALLLMPDIIVKKQCSEKCLFLSYDDGPNVNSTIKILNILDKYQAKASFFFIGEKIEENKNILEIIRSRGHSLGSHGMYHKRQPLFCLKDYINNVDKASKLIGTKLFRPSYGFITPCAYQKLKNKYEIVLWDVMPGDFIKNRNIDSLFDIVTAHAKNGSIIVLHESEGNINMTLELTEKILKYYSELDFKFMGM